MARKKSLSASEFGGAALAAFSLSVNTLRYLQKNGALSQEEVNSVVSGVLLSLERNESVSQSASHVARELLSGVAADLGVPMKTPH